MMKLKFQWNVLSVLWIVFLLTALLNWPFHGPFEWRVYTGVIGLVLVTILRLRESFSYLVFLFLLLAAATLGFAQLNSAFGFAMNFGFLQRIGGSVNFYPMILLFYVLYKDSDKIADHLVPVFGKTENEKQKDLDQSKNRFKEKFEVLTIAQLEAKLEQDLAKDARLAVEEILEERKYEA